MGVSAVPGTTGGLPSRVPADAGARRVVVVAAAATAVLSALALALVPAGGPYALRVDDLQELVAASGASLAVAVAAGRRAGPGRVRSAVMAVSLACGFFGMLIWDASEGLGLPALMTLGDLVFVTGSCLGIVTIAAAVLGDLPRERLTAVGIDTLIVLLGGMAIIAALWREGIVASSDRLSSIGAVLMIAAAAGCAFSLFSRNIGWSSPGPWILLLGGLVLGTSWLMWTGGLASPDSVDVSDFMFSAGLLLIAQGVVVWRVRPSTGRRYELLSNTLRSLLPISAIIVSLALLALTRGPDFADLLGVAASAAIVTSAIRQLVLFWSEARARHAVAVRTAELQAALGALETEMGERQRLEAEQEAMRLRMVEGQRLESIGRLAGGVAHDFNNLLTAIRGYADMVAQRLPPSDDGQRELTALRAATDQAGSLTAQLLAFSRNQRLRPNILDLGEVVARTEPLLRRLLGERIELVVKLGPLLPPVLADSSQIESVIVNLAVNARDAMASGGRLTIETAGVTLAADADVVNAEVTPGPYAMVAVSDTGAGMDEETLRHIFEPFFTTKKQGEGTGLGLAVVYGTVRQSEGHVGVSSNPGVGTTFRIYLPATDRTAAQVAAEVAAEAAAEATGAPAVAPVAARPAAKKGSRSRRPATAAAAPHSTPAPSERPAAPATAAPASPSAPPAPAGRRRILIAEDEAPVRDMLATSLTHKGFEVAAVRSGEEALAELAAGGEFGVLLTDVVMPGMSGLELASKARSRRPDLHVVCMSGYTPPEADQAVDPEVRFLAKPFTLRKLEALLREILGD